MPKPETKKTSKKEESEADKFPCTIDKTLLSSWQLMRRTGDIEELVELTKKSRPIVYQALKYGYLKDNDLERAISNYYINRAETQRKEAQEILKNIA